jgi:hypothetical protein
MISQLAEKLENLVSFVSGHGFSRAANATKQMSGFNP